MDLGPHLVTGSADGWTHVYEDVSGPGSEPRSQTADPFLQNARHHSSPTRVEKCQRPTGWVNEEHRNTVGHRHAHENPLGGGDMAIRGEGEGRLVEPDIASVRFDLVMKQNGLAMDLVGADYPRETQGSAQGHPLDRLTCGLTISEKSEIR